MEQLRAKRHERLVEASERAGKKRSAADFTGIRRIHFLFDRLTRKFHGDVAAWLEFARFAVRAGSGKAAGRVFARAIQHHPRKVEVWMAAARWEWEDNGNVSAARALLQRALRLNAGEKELWMYYFHLEMLFLVKLKERQRVLGGGIKESVEMMATCERKTAAMSSDDEEGDDNTDMLHPKDDEQPAADPLAALATFYDGQIPLTVFRNTMLALPKDASLPFDILAAYRDYEFKYPVVAAACAKGIAAVVDAIRETYSNDAEVLARLAERHVANAPSINHKSFAAKLKSCIVEYAELAQRFAGNAASSALLNECYVAFLERLAGQCDEGTDVNVVEFIQRGLGAAKKQQLQA